MLIETHLILLNELIKNNQKGFVIAFHLAKYSSTLHNFNYLTHYNKEFLVILLKND